MIVVRIDLHVIIGGKIVPIQFLHRILSTVFHQLRAFMLHYGALLLEGSGFSIRGFNGLVLFKANAFILELMVQLLFFLLDLLLSFNIVFVWQGL